MESVRTAVSWKWVTRALPVTWGQLCTCRAVGSVVVSSRLLLDWLGPLCASIRIPFSLPTPPFACSSFQSLPRAPVAPVLAAVTGAGAEGGQVPDRWLPGREGHLGHGTLLSAPSPRAQLLCILCRVQSIVSKETEYKNRGLESSFKHGEENIANSENVVLFRCFFSS